MQQFVYGKKVEEKGLHTIREERMGNEGNGMKQIDNEELGDKR